MNKREQYIEALRSYIGTPFRHQGQSKQGMDCLGLLIAAGRDIGLEVPSNLTYMPNPDSGELEKRSKQFLRQLPYNRLQRVGNQIQPGDVLTFWIVERGQPKHFAVYTGLDNHGRESVIHAYSRKQYGVIETTIANKFLSRRIDKAWRIPQLGD